MLNIYVRLFQSILLYGRWVSKLIMIFDEMKKKADQLSNSSVKYTIQLYTFDYLIDSLLEKSYEGSFLSVLVSISVDTIFVGFYTKSAEFVLLTPKLFLEEICMLETGVGITFLCVCFGGFQFLSLLVPFYILRASYFLSSVGFEGDFLLFETIGFILVISCYNYLFVTYSFDIYYCILTIFNYNYSDKATTKSLSLQF